MKNYLSHLNLIPDKIDLQAILISFAIINFAFLYHTFNFMWGNHDVEFIKSELLLSSGLFEGRFSQFIPHQLLTQGQILPILNNLLGFLFITLGLWILAKYWQVPKSTLNYVLFISFFATLPYMLAWMYFSFITISCLLWVFIAVLGLYLAEYIHKTPNKVMLSFYSILSFYITLGGYPPIINTFFVCLSARLTIAYLFENKTLKELWNIYKYTLFNIIIATILFKLTLKLLPHDNVYNLQTTPLDELPLKFWKTLKIALTQFFIAVPFMERGYKAVLFLMSASAIIGAILTTTQKRKCFMTIFFIGGTIFMTSLTTFLVIPHTEYVSRIDFYGIAFLYTFFLALLLKYKKNISHSLALIYMMILIPFNIINDYQAQKIWKQGQQAEFKILDRVNERVENHPKFNPHKKYRFYQAGDISLRPNYYKKKFDVDDVFLLSLPYLAMWQGANLMEFYSPFSYIDHTLPILPSDITPEVYDFFTNKAQPWPHQNSVYVNNDIIIVIYNQYGLDDFHRKIKEIYPIN